MNEKLYEYNFKRNVKIMISMCIAYFERWSRGGMFHESFVLVERGRWQLKELLKKHIIYSGSRILYFYILKHANYHF
jgi:hypothetical protein